ncbi:rod shape-determining protein MreC [Qipengyuania sp. DGS5-3]|uniref:rod shape-determining protein MreC n=1 Tax=Qipengyuania sp. DGS5-3 TaxID=3349632 RepID=UPI0036D2E997
MAPPNKRASPYSRKVQYNLFTGYFLAGMGALIGAVLIAISLWQPSFFSGVRGAAQDAVAPATETVASARTESKGLFETVRGYLDAGAQNAELRREVELARIRLKETAAIEQENARLKSLLDLRTEDPSPVATVRMIGSSASSTRRFGYIAAGRSDGVAVGMPVRSDKGIVGRILEVSSNTARVLLLTDSESVLPVRKAGSSVAAFAQGRGDGIVRVRLINLGINPLEPGDVMVTSGSGGYYQPGIAVAIVTEVTDDGALARVVSDPAATDYISVMPIFEPLALSSAQTPVEQPLSDQDEAPGSQ